MFRVKLLTPWFGYKKGDIANAKRFKNMNKDEINRAVITWESYDDDCIFIESYENSNDFIYYMWNKEIEIIKED